MAQAKVIADRLLAVLRPAEGAYWVAAAGSFVPQVAVLTDSRLLVFGLTSSKSPLVMGLPYRVDLVKEKLLGQEVTLTHAEGGRITLVVQPDDLAKIRAHSSTMPPPSASANDASYASPMGATAGAGGGVGVAGAVAGAPGAWSWDRPVLTPTDAEYLAASHMAYLGFQGVQVTQVSGDRGLDAVAIGAAAQVKFHAAPTGRPDVQQLRGAADSFPCRLFYATGYTPQGMEAAQQLGVALFQFTPEGLVVAINDAARTLGQRGYTPPAPRGALGALTFEARQNRAVGWGQQIQSAAQTPISDRRRKGEKQMQQRLTALSLLTQGLAELQDSDNPLYKKGRKQRTLAQAEKTLKSAAQVLGIRLR